MSNLRPAEIAAEWRFIADTIEALLPHVEPVERIAPAIIVEAYRAKAKKLDRLPSNDD